MAIVLREPPAASGWPKTLSIIVELTLRLWANSVFKGLGSRRKLFVLIGVSVFFLLSYVALGTAFFRELMPFDDPEQMAQAGPLLAFLLTTPGVFLTVLCFIYAPPASNIMIFLSIFPMKQSHIHTILSWLSLLLGVGFAALFMLPLVLSMLMGAGGIPTALSCFLYSLFLITLSALAAHALLCAIIAVPTLFKRAPSLVLRGFAALFTVAFIVYLLFQAVPFGREHQPYGPAVFYGEIFAVIFRGGPLHPLQLAGIILPPVFFVACSLLLGRRHRAADYLGVPSPRSLRLNLHGIGRHRPFPLYILEVKQWLRFPSNAVNVVFFLGLSCLLVLLQCVSGGESGALGINQLLPLLFGTVAVSFYGVTKPYHWLYRTLRPPAAAPWIGAKLQASLALWLTLNMLYVPLMAIIGGIAPAGFVFLLPSLLLELVIGLIVGLFFLAAKEQTFGTTLSEAIAALAIVFAGIGLENMLSSLTELMPVMLIKWGALACAVGVYYYAARARSRHNAIDNQ